MNISIRGVLLLVFLGAGSTLGACGGYVNLGDPEGDGGEGGSPSEGTGGGTTPGTGGGSASGGSAGIGSGGGSAEAGTGGGSAEAGTSGGSAEAGTGGGGTAGAGTGGGGAAGAYEPRSGAFNMLVYSRTEGFRHEDSIRTGKVMLDEIAAEQGFDVTMTETNEEITPAGLSQYEVVFFLNPTGDIFDTAEEQAFEEWMTTQNGAFVGVHSATDTENGWAFYSEVTGQYFDLHGPSGTAGQIVIQDAGLDFPGLSGLPNPWQRVEEWYRFNRHAEWSAKPGFEILARNAADDHPVIWTREYANFRSFYTSLGHDPVVFEDESVKRLLTGGILWAVRREHLFE